jgi:hypothetical protein
MITNFDGWETGCTDGYRKMDAPPRLHGERLTMASEKECMDHASECVRLAGLTDDIAVRDQLVELAQSWISAAQRERRVAQVITLYPHHEPSRD